MLYDHKALCNGKVHKVIRFVSPGRAFVVSGNLKPEEAVQATLSSLPDEVVDTVGITSLPSEDSVSERRRKLEYLEMQEELIKVLTSYHGLFLHNISENVDLYDLSCCISILDSKIVGLVSLVSRCLCI